MRSFLLTTLSIVGFGLTTQAFAAGAVDAAYNHDNKPIYDSQGNCVRTQWQGKNDPCAPAAKAAAPVAEAPAPAPAPFKKVEAHVPNISHEARSGYFDFNKATLTAAAKTKLDELAAIINKSSEIKDVSIHGFTDQIGTDAANATLAHKRAQAVKEYLDSKSRLKSNEGDIRGLGKSSPEAGCANIKKRAAKVSCMNKERRVEVEFKAQE